MALGARARVLWGFGDSGVCAFRCWGLGFFRVRDLGFRISYSVHELARSLSLSL